MTSSNSAQNNFPEALKVSRKCLGVTQEAFHPVSGRTYISALERGLKSPTLTKVDELSAVLGIHPLTLLTLSYAKKRNPESIGLTTDFVAAEVRKILDLIEQTH